MFLLSWHSPSPKFSHRFRIIAWIRSAMSGYHQRCTAVLFFNSARSPLILSLCFLALGFLFLGIWYSLYLSERFLIPFIASRARHTPRGPWTGFESAIATQRSECQHPMIYLQYTFLESLGRDGSMISTPLAIFDEVVPSFQRLLSFSTQSFQDFNANASSNSRQVSSMISTPINHTFQYSTRHQGVCA